MAPSIHLDPSIGAWMLLPIVLLTIMATMLRQGLSQMMQKPGQAPGAAMMPTGKPTMTDIHTNQVVTASKITRMSASCLTPASLLARRIYYLGKNEDGKLCNPPEAGPSTIQTMMAQDPSAMTGMMKYNFAFLILNGGLAYLVSYLFTDAVVGRTPFPLSPSFKGILQRGVDVPDLDASYISALSWYFLIFFGSSSFMFLINKALTPLLGHQEAQSVLAVMDPMMAGMMGGGAQQPSFSPQDPAKIFGAEADNWKMMAHTPFLPEVSEQIKEALADGI